MTRILCAFAAFLALGLRASADAPINFSQPFSADQVATDAQGYTHAGHVLSTGSKMRMEMEPSNGVATTLLVRPDLQKVYLLMDAQKMAIEFPLNPDRYKGIMTFLNGGEGAYTKVADDSVDGVACIKYQVTDKEGKSFFAWGTPDGTPVKIAGTDNSYSVTWKNYKAGPQDPAKFEVPAGYGMTPVSAGAMQ